LTQNVVLAYTKVV